MSALNGSTVQTYIERVEIDQRFAGRAPDCPLERFKALVADGWELTVLIEYEPPTRRRALPKATGYVIALGCREVDE